MAGLRFMSRYTQGNDEEGRQDELGDVSFAMGGFRDVEDRNREAIEVCWEGQ